MGKHGFAALQNLTDGVTHMRKHGFAVLGDHGSLFTVQTDGGVVE